MIDIPRGVRSGEEIRRGLPTATRRQHAVVHRGQLPLDLKRSVATGDLMRCNTIREMLDLMQSQYDTDQPLDFISKNTIAVFLGQAPRVLKLKKR